jgi:hypothetical protein
MHYRCIILPRLKNEYFYEVDLAKEYEVLKQEKKVPESSDMPNQPGEMKAIEVQDELLTYVQKKYHTKHTIGGYSEDRSKLWLGFEKSAKMLHLGVDINNLQVGEPVSLPRDAIVIHVLKDTSELNGWGGRLIFKMKTPFQGADYLLYGHLSHDLPEVGMVFKAGDIIGHIGNSDQNGGWFVHLHVQLIKQAMIDQYLEDLRYIDGYLLDSDGKTEVSDISSDPTFLICNIVESELKKDSLKDF